MAMEHFEEATIQNDSFGEDKSTLSSWKFNSNSTKDVNGDVPGGFECNICLDTVQDPVVTLCGHLFCWPCIYKWLHFQTISASKQDHQQQCCPVCKAKVSHTALVPLYGKGQTTKPTKTKAPHLGIVIPRRPTGPSYGVHTPASITQNPPQRNYAQVNPRTPHDTMMSTFDPMIGVFGEMVYARAFGNTITNLYTYPNSYDLFGSSSSPRVRRHLMKTDESLNRLCFFLFCCVTLCLLLF